MSESKGPRTRQEIVKTTPQVEWSEQPLKIVSMYFRHGTSQGITADLASQEAMKRCAALKPDDLVGLIFNRDRMIVDAVIPAPDPGIHEGVSTSEYVTYQRLDREPEVELGKATILSVTLEFDGGSIQVFTCEMAAPALLERLSKLTPGDIVQLIMETDGKVADFIRTGRRD